MILGIVEYTTAYLWIDQFTLLQPYQLVQQLILTGSHTELGQGALSQTLGVAEFQGELDLRVVLRILNQGVVVDIAVGRSFLKRRINQNWSQIK